MSTRRASSRTSSPLTTASGPSGTSKSTGRRSRIASDTTATASQSATQSASPQRSSSTSRTRSSSGAPRSPSSKSTRSPSASPSSSGRDARAVRSPSRGSTKSPTPTPATTATSSTATSSTTTRANSSSKRSSNKGLRRSSSAKSSGGGSQERSSSLSRQRSAGSPLSSPKSGSGKSSPKSSVRQSSQRPREGSLTRQPSLPSSPLTHTNSLRNAPASPLRSPGPKSPSSKSPSSKKGSGGGGGGGRRSATASPVPSVAFKSTVSSRARVRPGSSLALESSSREEFGDYELSGGGGGGYRDGSDDSGGSGGSGSSAEFDDRSGDRGGDRGLGLARRYDGRRDERQRHGQGRVGHRDDDSDSLPVFQGEFVGWAERSDGERASGRVGELDRGGRRGKGAQGDLFRSKFSPLAPLVTTTTSTTATAVGGGAGGAGGGAGAVSVAGDLDTEAEYVDDDGTVVDFGLPAAAAAPAARPPSESTGDDATEDDGGRAGDGDGDGDGGGADGGSSGLLSWGGLGTTALAAVKLAADDTSRYSRSMSSLNNNERALLEEILVLRQAPAAFADRILDLIENNVKNEFIGGDINYPIDVLRFERGDPRRPLSGMRVRGKAARLYEIVDWLKSIPTEEIQPVKWSYGLTLAARDHCDDIGPKRGVGEVGGDGSIPLDRAERYGRAYGTVVQWQAHDGQVSPFLSVLRMLGSDAAAGSGPIPTGLGLLVAGSVGVGYSRAPGFRPVTAVVLAEGYVESAQHNQDNARGVTEATLARQVDGSRPCPGCRQPIVHPSPTNDSEWSHYLAMTGFVGEREWHVDCVKCHSCGSNPRPWRAVDGRAYCALSTTCAPR